MDLFAEHVDVWAAPIADRPGALAAVLGALRDARLNPQSIIARRTPEHGGNAVVFIWPLEGDREIAAASQIGFNLSRSMHAVRAVGPYRTGLAAELTQMAADAGINLHGFSSSVIGSRFVAYFAADSIEDASRLVEMLGGTALARAA